ncbi:ABC transporter permease [Buchananella felis]|uniref:ABC transporter permease n=1 Tax=Buchananella felis TaxID=3231492 RepID=UPI0035275986
MNRLTRLLAPIAVGALLLAAWAWASGSGAVAPFLLPSPARVLTHLLASFTGTIAPAAWETLRAALIGCAAAVVVAAPLAYVIWRWRWADAALSPYLAASQAVPAIALAPLLAVWLGYGLTPTVVLCALIVFFPIFVATLNALRGIDPDLLDAARLDGTTPAQLLIHIQAPLALPGFMSGLRAGFPLSITGAVVGEFVLGGKGMGMLLTAQRQAANTAGMFATILVLAVMASLFYVALQILEHLSPTIAALRSK